MLAGIAGILCGTMAAKKSGPLSKKDWQGVREKLADSYPDATDGILFCVHKLKQDPNISIPDFRDEAKKVGISIAGRSLHSAKVLLGMAEPSVRKKTGGARKKKASAKTGGRRGPGRPRAGASLAGGIGLEDLVGQIKEFEREMIRYRGIVEKIRNLVNE